MARLENTLGRKLTRREVETVAEGLPDQAERYGEIDVQAVSDDHHEQAGTKAPDLDNKHERHKYMAKRLADDRIANAPDDSRREYDLDDTTDRQAYMVARLNGEEFKDAPAKSDA